MSTIAKYDYTSVISNDGDMFLEPCRGFWSIVRPHGRDLENGVVNPSFESGLRNYWHANFNPDTSTNTALTVVARSAANQDAAWSGNYSLLMQTTIDGQPYGAFYSPRSSADPSAGDILIENGETLYVSAWVKACAGDLITLYANGDGIMPAIAGLVQRQSSVRATGQWQRVRTSITNSMPYPTQAFAGVKVVITPASAGCGSAWLDAICITTVKADYFDGNSEGAIWSGQPELSKSIISRFSRLMGEEIWLKDVGLNIISFTGHGMTPVDLDTIPYAQGGGSYYNRTWPAAVRTITLVGSLESQYGPKDLQKQHSRLIELVGLHRFSIDTQEFRLRYRLTKQDRETTGALEIHCVYKAGLEGNTTVLHQERVTLQMDAYEDQFWHDPTTKWVALDANQATHIHYNGTAPSPMLIVVVGQSFGLNNTDLTSIENLTLGTGLYFQSPDGAPFVPVGDLHTLFIGDLDRICANAYLRNKATGGFVNRTGYIVRPQSVPSEFFLLNGDNDILPTFVSRDGVTPIVFMAYRERYLSATDVWRVAASGDSGPTDDLSSFRRNGQ
jgi:hypothetical protein